MRSDIIDCAYFEGPLACKQAQQPAGSPCTTRPWGCTHVAEDTNCLQVTNMASTTTVCKEGGHPHHAVVIVAHILHRRLAKSAECNYSHARGMLGLHGCLPRAHICAYLSRRARICKRQYTCCSNAPSACYGNKSHCVVMPKNSNSVQLRYKHSPPRSHTQGCSGQQGPKCSMTLPQCSLSLCLLISCQIKL
jgi:hypothetical protein